GCGVSLAGAAPAPSPGGVGGALAALGMFAAVYHPVGTAMLIEQATSRGRSLALHRGWGDFRVALAARTTAPPGYRVGRGGAFLVPALVCIATGIAYLMLIPDDRHKTAGRTSTPEVVFAPWMAAAIFALFILIAISAGLVFHVTTVALPKIVDERLGLSISL